MAIVSPDAPTKVLQKPEATAAEAREARRSLLPSSPRPSSPPPNRSPPSSSASMLSIMMPAAISYSPARARRATPPASMSTIASSGMRPVGDDGRWSYSATASISQGVHTLRVDGLDAKGSVREPRRSSHLPRGPDQGCRRNAACRPEPPQTEQPAAAATNSEAAAPAETAKAEQPAPAVTEADEDRTRTADRPPWPNNPPRRTNLQPARRRKPPRLPPSRKPPSRPRRPLPPPRQMPQARQCPRKAASSSSRATTSGASRACSMATATSSPCCMRRTRIRSAIRTGSIPARCSGLLKWPQSQA